MNYGDSTRYITRRWKFSAIFLLLSFTSAEAFHYYKLKKLLTAYALAKAFSGRKPSTTVIPIPIPIPIPVQQNEIIRVPSQSSGKTYVTSGIPHGLGQSLHGGGGGVYKITTINKGRHQGIQSLNRLNGEGGAVFGLADDGGHSMGGLGSLGGSVPNIIYTGGGGPSFGYGGHRDFTHVYDNDYQQDFAPSNVYRDRKPKRYRTRYPPRGRRIRSHRYYDFPDDSEHYVRGRRSRRCRTRSKCGHRPVPDDGPIPDQTGPIPVGEVYGAKYSDFANNN